LTFPLFLYLYNKSRKKGKKQKKQKKKKKTLIQMALKERFTQIQPDGSWEIPRKLFHFSIGKENKKQERKTERKQG
jgi:hypothetical protein